MFNTLFHKAFKSSGLHCKSKYPHGVFFLSLYLVNLLLLDERVAMISVNRFAPLTSMKQGHGNHSYSMPISCDLTTVEVKFMVILLLLLNSRLYLFLGLGLSPRLPFAWHGLL